MNPKKAVALLEVMWDNRYPGRTAPRSFCINPRNFTGKRLYTWLGSNFSLKVTNACPKIVGNAQGKGISDRNWVKQNLNNLLPFDLLLVCGKVAAATVDFNFVPAGVRVLVAPHPANRSWNQKALSAMARLVQHGTDSAVISIAKDGLSIHKLPSKPTLF